MISQQDNTIRLWQGGEQLRHWLSHHRSSVVPGCAVFRIIRVMSAIVAVVGGDATARAGTTSLPQTQQKNGFGFSLSFDSCSVDIVWASYLAIYGDSVPLGPIPTGRGRPTTAVSFRRRPSPGMDV